MSEQGAVALPDKAANRAPVVLSKTYSAKDGATSEKVRLDVQGWGINQVRDFMVAILADEMQQQIRLDNPPAFANVDGVQGRALVNIQRRATVSFGVRLKVAALNALKAGLAQAISKSTTRHTGTLSNMANWEFRYVRNGKVTPLPLTGASGIPMGPSDFIVLMPKQVIDARGRAYATAVNMRVAGSGKLSFRKSMKSRPTKANQSIGFLALASRAANASAAFAGFTVSSGFTVRHAVRGEVVKLGGVRTGFIKIRPNTGSSRGRR